MRTWLSLLRSPPGRLLANGRDLSCDGETSISLQMLRNAWTEKGGHCQRALHPVSHALLTAFESIKYRLWHQFSLALRLQRSSTNSRRNFKNLLGGPPTRINQCPLLLNGVLICSAGAMALCTVCWSSTFHRYHISL